MPTPSLLIIGGTGFVSGTLAAEAIGAGWKVWALTRGRRPAAPGVLPLIADRKDREAFSKAVKSAGATFDLAVDCIGYEPADAKADMEVLPSVARQFVFISTDFVYDPARRIFPQSESDAVYLDANNYGGAKRRCELEITSADTGSMPWTIVRPCHIYGPGSLLGCSPPGNRDAGLLQKINAGESIPIVGGNYLQQPLFAPDLARLILSVKSNPNAHRQIFNVAGPDVIESITYYKLIAKALGKTLQYAEIPVGEYLTANPDKASFLCHRIYDLSRLKAAGLKVPSTPIAVGIAEHVKSLLGQ